MESEYEIRQEVRRLSGQIDTLYHIVKDLAVSIRSQQKPMTRQEFAARVGISEGKLRKMIKEGRVRTMGNARARRIPATELREFDI